MLKDSIKELKKELSSIEDGFKKQLTKLRTGRASASMLDGINVDYFGVPTPISQVATISIPQGDLIQIQPWDVKMIQEIEKAVINANIGITPVSDGRLLRLNIPQLDEQRRKEIVKTLKSYTEERKTAIRNLRREYRDIAKTLKDDKDISEDEEKRFYDEIQKVIDSKIKDIEEIAKDKEKIIMDN